MLDRFPIIKYVRIPNWLVPRWWEVAYLIIDPEGRLREDLAELIEIKPNEQFDELVSTHVTAYIQKGTIPPEDIAPAILNLADDLMSGRKMSIRAGDYIAIQNHLRRMK